MVEEKLEKVDIRKCIHPKEKSRYWLAVGTITVIILPVIVLYIIGTLIKQSLPTILAIVVVLNIFFWSWVVMRIFRAYLLGSCAEVSHDNFPEIYGLLEKIRTHLDYPKKIEAYIFQEGDVNAFLVRRFRTRIILLPHGLVANMLEGKGQVELKWILSRFVGHLKAKHLRFWWLNILIESLEKLRFFSILLYPWERATQYTGDRIGLAVCSDLNATIIATNKLMLGNELAERTTLLGALKQREKLKGSFFGWIAECVSTHPHLTNRIASLISWSNDYNPALYERFMANQSKRRQIESLL